MMTGLTGLDGKYTKTFPKSKKGNAFLLVIVDYFTKWGELFCLLRQQDSDCQIIKGTPIL